ncbi:MAG: SCO6880 family protein [Acidimicrobiia bacterium]
MSTAERLYRFAPRDRAGWILGLGATQCLTLSACLLVGALLVSAGAPTIVAAVPLIAGVVFSFARWQGRPLHAWAPVLAAWGVLRLGGATRWTARVPLLAETGAPKAAPLPPFLAGLEILEASAPWTRRRRLGSVGLVADRRERLLSAALRVQGREFTLVDRAEQDRLLTGWGDVLAGFCRERGSVARVAWSEWAAPAGLEEHLRYVEAEATAPEDSPHRAAYLALVDQAGPMTTRHEVLVTVTFDTRRVRVQRKPGTALDDSLADLLLEELRLLTTRLEDAGLSVDVPLSPQELREVLRVRLDPMVLPRFAARARAGPEGPPVGPHNVGPLCVDLELPRVRIDGSWHRSYWIGEWPRLEMHPAWMEPLLLHAGGVRTVAVAYEPVAPSRSQRQIDRDATKLASDEEQRVKRGFRVGAQHRRAQTAVLEREAELVAGYAELEYVGFVTVTAPDPARLDQSCAEYEQAAAHAGLELRALDGQHDAGTGACLPIGRYPTARRFN